MEIQSQIVHIGLQNVYIDTIANAYAPLNEKDTQTLAKSIQSFYIDGQSQFYSNNKNIIHANGMNHPLFEDFINYLIQRRESVWNGNSPNISYWMNHPHSKVFDDVKTLGYKSMGSLVNEILTKDDPHALEKFFLLIKAGDKLLKRYGFSEGTAFNLPRPREDSIVFFSDSHNPSKVVSSTYPPFFTPYLFGKAISQQ